MLDVHEGALGLGQDGALVLRVAAHAAHRILQFGGDAAPFDAAAQKEVAIAHLLGLGRRLGIAVGAVDQAFSEAVQNLDVVAIGAAHQKPPWLTQVKPASPAKVARHRLARRSEFGRERAQTDFALELGPQRP
ncbi:hypothetical protein D3C80_1800080 [compost metagenome]